ncbi:MAG: redoxin family protein [Planctomycetota bacterium]
MKRCIAVVAILVFVGTASAGPEDAPLRRTTGEEDARSLGVGRVVADFKLDPLVGEDTSLVKLLAGRKGLVVCMTSTECPAAVRYAPRLASIEDEYAKRGIAFVFVNAVEAEKAADMQAMIRLVGFDGPYVADRSHEVRRAMDARTTTEVFVLEPSRTLLYRGAIDDQYGVGLAQDAPKRHYLRETLDAMLSGKRPVVQATWPPGCILDKSRATTKPANELTYYGRVAHIMAEKCVGCHRQGGVAPFSLETVESVKGRVSMIEAVVRDRLMPPGHVLSHKPGAANPWVNDPALNEDDRRDMLAWLRSDRPAGERAAGPVIAPLSGTWLIGQPDWIVATPPLVLPVNGPLQYGRFVVPMGVDAEKWISAVEFRPMERDTVHHALVWILPPGAQYPSLDVMPTELELLGVFSPAQGVTRYAAGTGRRLPAGAVLLVDLYARPMGRAMGARLRVAMRFATERPQSVVSTLIVSERDVQIAPGESHFERRVEFSPGEAMLIRSVTPYMRARGRSVEVVVGWPDGREESILSAERYDFRWPIRYERSEALLLSAGMRLGVSCVFDNSRAQLANPNLEATVRIGPKAGDEAFMAIFEVERLGGNVETGAEGR